MCCGDKPCHAHVQRALSRTLDRYGRLVAAHPWPFIVLPLLIFGGLGAGLMRLDKAGKSEDVFLPRYSQGFKDRETVQELFPDRTRDFYDALELNEEQIMGSLIFKARDNRSVYDPEVVTEIRDVIAKIKANVTVKVGDEIYMYEDLCGRRDNSCVVTGERLLAPQFDAMRQMGILTYPKWRLPTTNETVDLSFALADSDALLKRVGAVRVTFKLRHDQKDKSLAWERAFVEFARGLETNNTDIAFSSSHSFREELYADFNYDLFYFWLSLGLMALCACLVCTRCDMVSTRALLITSGVLSAGAGTVGAFGVLALCDIEIVDMAWVAPFLVLAMRLGDALVLMTAWSDTLSQTELHVPERVGMALTSAGVGVTVTSLSVLAGFCIGYTSSFLIVSNFCLYAGVAVGFSYVCSMTVTVGCLSVHGQRLYAARHCLTCCPIKPRDQLHKEGRLLCTALLCGGSVPKENGEDQSPCEKLTQLALKKIISSTVARILVLLLFVGYLSVSIYGVTKLEQGVRLKKLIPESSYFHKYISWDSMYFGFSFPVVFYLRPGVQYDETTARRMGQLMQTAKADKQVDGEFERCWLTAFIASSHYNGSQTGGRFTGPSVEEFLVETKTYLGDVVMDESGEGIIASRCFVFSEKIKNPNKLSGLMARMRGVATSSGLPVFAFHPAFLNYEQLLDVMHTTLQTIGVTVGALCVICILFLPQLIVVCVSTVSCVCVVVGVFGFLSFWDVNLSVFIMNHVIMSTGFAIFLSVPACSAYFVSQSCTRAERASDSVARAAGALFNTGTCAAVALLPLLLGQCFFFDILFKVMLLATLFGTLHGGLFVPVILSLIGHEDSDSVPRRRKASVNRSIASGGATAKQTSKTATASPKTPRQQGKKMDGRYVDANTMDEGPANTGLSMYQTTNYYNAPATQSNDLDINSRDNMGSASPVIGEYELVSMPKTGNNGGKLAKKKGKGSFQQNEHIFNDLNSSHLYENDQFDGRNGPIASNGYINFDHMIRPPSETEVYDTPLPVARLKAPRDHCAPPVPAKPKFANSFLQPPSRNSPFNPTAPSTNPRNSVNPFSPTVPSTQLSGGYSAAKWVDEHDTYPEYSYSHAGSFYENNPPPRKESPHPPHQVKNPVPEITYRHRKSLPENRLFHIQGSAFPNLHSDRNSYTPRSERRAKPHPQSDRHLHTPRSERRTRWRHMPALPSMEGRHVPGNRNVKPKSDIEKGYVNQSFADSVASLESIHHVACTLSNSGMLGSSQAYVTENFRDYPR